MEWVQTLQSFTMAVREGSLSAAGRLLGTSPASVSRHISSLEETLGAQLLKRSSRSIALTEAGELYYHQVIGILKDLQDANEQVAHLHSRPRGILRVHSRMLVGQMVILPSLPEFLAAHPEVSVHLSLSNVVAPVMSEGTDLDIRIGKLEDSMLIARKLASSRRILCAAPDYLEGKPPVGAPEDLMQHNCLTYRVNLGTPVWKFLSPAGEGSEIAVTGNMQTEFGYGLLAMARAGVGIALLPDWSVRDDLHSGALVHLLPDYQVTHIAFEDGVYAVYPTAKQTSAKLRVFVDHLVQVFRDRFHGARVSDYPR